MNMLSSMDNEYYENFEDFDDDDDEEDWGESKWANKLKYQ
jgi:hypothetical protein